MKLDFQLVKTQDELLKMRDIAKDIFSKEGNIHAKKMTKSLRDNVVLYFLRNTDNYLVNSIIDGTSVTVGVFSIWDIGNYISMLNQLAIKEEYRHQGIATQILEYVFEHYEKVMFNTEPKYLNLYRKATINNISIVTHMIVFKKRELVQPLYEIIHNKMVIRDSVICGVNIDLHDPNNEDALYEAVDKYNFYWYAWNRDKLNL